MVLFRIGSVLFPLFDGTGASLAGGRWNGPGRRAIYGASNLAAAQLEMLVHIGRSSPPLNHAWIEIYIPDDVAVKTLTRTELPAGWDHPTSKDTAQAVGDAWFASKETAVLRVPSVAAAVDWVWVIDQDHPEFARMRASSLVPLVWDVRLFGSP